jgi:hypothetical protein
MKTSLFSILFILFSVTIFAQNMGINVTNPKNPLHIKGRTQIDGRLSINQQNIGSLGGDLGYPIFEAISEASDSSDVNLVLFEDSEFSPWLNFAHARGTKASPTKVMFDDNLISIFGYGYDGLNFKKVGGIELKIDSLSGVDDMPTALRFYTSNNGQAGTFERMRIDHNGNVAIGNVPAFGSQTLAKLVVSGFQNSSVGNFTYFRKDFNPTTNAVGQNTTGNSQNYSIYATNRIAASEFNAFSDVRIKKIKGVSNSQQDLGTLIKLQITDYQLIDSISKGNTPYKKVIAQQVEKVYPQAVSKLTDCIPDIYQLAKIENGFVLLPNHNLKVGEKVKLIFEKNQEVVEVKNISKLGFQILEKSSKSKTSNLPVFVYSREVSDFRSVDYEALTTLNISATQALVKRLNEAENKIEALEKQQTGFRNLEKRITILEKLLLVKMQ